MSELILTVDYIKGPEDAVFNLEDFWATNF